MIQPTSSCMICSHLKVKQNVEEIFEKFWILKILEQKQAVFTVYSITAIFNQR
jgi:hypothetical protein